MPDWNMLFPGEKVSDPYLLSPLVLAYIGDAVYELCVRRHVIAGKFARTADIHKKTVKHVCADTQAGFLRSIQDTLSEEEALVVRRGRNAKGGQVPRGTSVTSYRYSTGLESLVGYLFLKGDLERLAEIMDNLFEFVDSGGV